jgi:hypothetical protein
MALLDIALGERNRALARLSGRVLGAQSGEHFANATIRSAAGRPNDCGTPGRLRESLSRFTLPTAIRRYMMRERNCQRNLHFAL